MKQKHSKYRKGNDVDNIIDNTKYINVRKIKVEGLK